MRAEAPCGVVRGDKSNVLAHKEARLFLAAEELTSIVRYVLRNVVDEAIRLSRRIKNSGRSRKFERIRSLGGSETLGGKNNFKWMLGSQRNSKGRGELKEEVVASRFLWDSTWTGRKGPHHVIQENIHLEVTCNWTCNLQRSAAAFLIALI